MTTPQPTPAPENTAATPVDKRTVTVAPDYGDLGDPQYFATIEDWGHLGTGTEEPMH